MTMMNVNTHTRQPDGRVYGGIDTHKDTHHVALVDHDGHELADAQFTTDTIGDTELIAWLTGWTGIERIAVEQTGTYGAGVTQSLQSAGYRVRELNAPDPAVRATRGKDDRIDAYMSAQAARTGRATTTPKDRTGIVESIRMLKLTRDSAVKSRTVALTQIQDLAVTAPTDVRAGFGTRPTARRIVNDALSWRVATSKIADPRHACRLALQRLARRIRDLDTEITAATKQLDTLTTTAAPTLRDRRQVGPEVAAQLLITVGQSPTRIRTDAQFARLCGIAPIPASSGTTTRMRLHRGGDRQANKAIHLVAIGRLKDYPPAITYRDRRRTENLSDKDIIRAMKRLIARELFTALTTDLTHLTQST